MLVGTTIPSPVPVRGCLAMPGSRHPKVVPAGEGGVLHWGVTSWVPRRGGGHAGMPVSQLYPTFPAPTAGVRRWLILSWLPPLYITLWILGSAAGTQPGSPTSVHGRARACKTSSGFSVLPSRGAGCCGLQQSLRRRQLFSVFSFFFSPSSSSSYPSPPSLLLFFFGGF